MGLILTTLNAAGSTLSDQWKEYFYCDSMAANVLVTKGKKRTSSRNSNTKTLYIGVTSFLLHCPYASL